MAASYNSNFAYNANGRIYNDPGLAPTTPGRAVFRTVSSTTMSNRARLSASTKPRTVQTATMKAR